MNLWLFGAIALSSVFIIYGWAAAAWKHREPLSVWNVALMLALALDIGAISLAAATGVRAYQLFIGDLPAMFFSGMMKLGLWGLLVSKVLLVWVACVQKGRRVSRLWPMYLAGLAGWAGFCALWG